MKNRFVCCLLSGHLSAAALAATDAPAASYSVAQIKPDKELLITACEVVDHPDHANPAKPTGRFTLEYLLTGIARDGKPKTALLEWLHAWKLTVNGQVYPLGQSVIDQWKCADGQAGLSDEFWQPKFVHAPFRLLAIVNRMDLIRVTEDSGKERYAPEGRFVFGVLDKDGAPLSATVIFEYRLPAKTMEEMQLWAESWHELASLEFSDPKYCQLLANLTERFTSRASLASPSLLAQIRTNEQDLSLRFVTDDEWSLHEFRLDPAGAIVAAPTRQTPATHLALTSRLGHYINEYAKRIEKGLYEVPETYCDKPFLGDQAITNPIGARNWVPAGVLEENKPAEKKFVENTCNGCHGQETQTPFLHIRPRITGEPAKLSAFLRKKDNSWSEEMNFRAGKLVDFLNWKSSAPPTHTAKGSPQVLALPLPVADGPIVPMELRARGGRVH
ncbi:MAG TPA: hypothetical protein VIM71_12360 [Lacunisphaera sp.]